MNLNVQLFKFLINSFHLPPIKDTDVATGHAGSSFFSSYAVTSFQKYYSIFIGLNIADGDDIELYKEGDYTEGLIPEYLRKLLQLSKLSNSQLDILCNLSLLPLLDHTHPYSRIILLICFDVIITLSVFYKSTSPASEIPVRW